MLCYTITSGKLTLTKFVEQFKVNLLSYNAYYAFKNIFV